MPEGFSIHQARRNFRIGYLSSFIEGLEFIIPIYMLLLQDVLKNSFYISLIVSLSAISIVILEIPSGAYADLLGRRRSMILSGVINIIAFILLLIAQDFVSFMIFALFRSLARSLSSGTMTALIYDSLLALTPNERKQLPSFKKIIGITNMLWPAGAFLASIIGGYLSMSGYTLPILATLISFGILAFLSVFLIEAPYQKSERTSLLEQITDSSILVKRTPGLLIFIFSGFLAFAFGEIVHNFKGIYYNSLEFSENWIGIWMAGSFGFSFLGSLFSEGVSRKLGDKWTLIICQSIPGVLLLIAVLFSNRYFAGILLSLSSIFWGIRNPVQSHQINLRCPSEKRATINSISNLANYLAITTFMPMAGILIEIQGLRITFFIIALFEVMVGLFLFKLPSSPVISLNER